MPPDMPCPSAELLRRSLDPDDPMTEPERQRIEAHVGRCTRGCKQAIDVLLRGHTELAGPGTAGPVNAPAAVESECPARLGRYRIVGALGSGGFGTVYRGYDDELRRDVAVKAPHRRRIAAPADAEAYLAEARTVAGLDHPHIVPVFDLGRGDDGLCFVVSRFIEGGDLAQRISEARPPYAESAALAAAVAEALHHAHKRGLVHRDVKPANILIDRAGTPFLTDFGLALKEEDFGKGGGLAGTPAYMSPEQASGEGHRVDGRSDVFSLGVVLYELLTGRRPFRGESAGDMLAQITGVEARPPRQIDDAIPKELERICLKALSKRASDRYTTARDMADDLCHFLAGTAPEGKSERKSEFAEGSGTAPAVPGPAPTPASDSRPLKVVPKGLRSFDAHDADFFLELLPGPRDRDGLPDGIRFWKTRMEETDADNTFAVGLLYGPSGCGKSSLVKAGLLPRLSDKVIAVYVEATAEETETRLLNGLRKRCPALSGTLGLKETLAALRRGQGVPVGKKVVIVLDQFEQWLHARRNQENTELVQALRHCDGGRVQCIVMVRDDFWMAATRFMWDLEIRLVEAQNSAAVDLFPIRHAEKVLAALGRAFGALPEPALAKPTDPSLQALVRRLEQLPDQFRELREGVQKAIQVADVDPEMALTRTRKVLEYVVRDVYERRISEPPGTRPLENLLQRIVKDGHFPERLDAYANTIRKLGNVGTHAFGGKVTAADVHQSLSQLMPILEWYFEAERPEAVAGRHPARPRPPTAVGGSGAADQEQKQFLEQAVSGLAQEGKVISVRLALFSEMMKGKAWTPATLKEVGGTEGVGVTFLEETFSAATAPPEHRYHQKAARAVLKALLPESGADIKGHMRSHAELLAASGYANRPKDFDDLLRILDGEIRLLTPTDPEGREEDAVSQVQTGQRYYQLTHDYLVPSLRDWLTRKQKETRRGRAELLLADRSAVWNARPENRQLPSLWQWLQIRWLTRKKNWTAAQRKMMRRAARNHAERVTALAILLASAILVGLGILSQVANQNRAAALVQRLLDADSEHLPDLIKQLEGCRYWAGERLRQASVEAEKTGDVRRRLNASLALLPEDAGQVDFLYAQFLDAEPPEAAVILGGLADSGHLGTDQGGGLELLKKTLRASAEDEADKERLAKRQANAAAALVRMGKGQAVWPMLKHSPDPRVRSYLIHRLSPLGADPGAVAGQLGVEKEVSIRRALLLILGEFGRDQFLPADGERLIQKVVQLYRDDPDPGLHGAAEWLLRQWGEDAKLKEVEAEWVKDGKKREQRQDQIRQELTGGKDQDEGYWYVNGQGQTMVVVPQPRQPFLMGSPTTEVGREAGETQHKEWIGRTFALAAKSVTVEQYRQFDKGYELPEKYTRTADLPVVGTSWCQAAVYCNWLTDQELTDQELPKEQWENQHCYLPNADGKYADGMKLAPNYLERTGYRLPTEAEMEVATRAGALTSRYFGETEDLLPKYAWYTKNSQEKTWPVGSLKPNDLGLFDVQGNVFTWCQESYKDYPAPKDDEVYGDNEDECSIVTCKIRMLRGRSFVDRASLVRSADRRTYVPTSQSINIGFRLARTFPP